MFKNNKKGFSLIEMLVVIAIIAVLVSIVVPTVSGYTIRSAAATNAANLRAIKGKLSTMRVLHSADFNTMMDELGVVGSAITGIWGDVLDGLYGDGVGDETITGLMCSFTANDGVLTLYAPNVVIEDVPVSKKMKLQGSNKSNSVTLEDGIQMSVLITENDIIPSYGGYTIEQFADIAEDGTLDDHTIAAPSGGGGIAGAICEFRGYHEDKNPVDEICDDCKYAMGYHDCKDANNNHVCDTSGCLAKLTTCSDSDTDSDHLCDYAGCKKRMSSCSDYAMSYTAEGHFCSNCGTKRGSHSGTSTCWTSECPYKKAECGCTQGKTNVTNWGLLGKYESAGKCENSACGHYHKAGEKCTDKSDTWVK